MAMLTESEVRAALNQVIHPSFGMSLIVLGMVNAVRVTETKIEIDLLMNCPGCPGGQATLDSIRHALRKLDSELPVKLNVLAQVWHPPWESEGLR